MWESTTEGEETQPVDGGGRETAAVGAGLRAAPELDGAAREEDVDEESGMVIAGALRKALNESRAALPSVAGNAQRTFPKRGASTRVVHNSPDRPAGVKPAPVQDSFKTRRARGHSCRLAAPRNRHLPSHVPDAVPRFHYPAKLHHTGGRR